MSFLVQYGPYQLDLQDPIDISIPIRRSQNVNAFHLPNPAFETVEAGSFVGSVRKGGSCNVENLHISAHGNGTHTECVGHISTENHYLKDSLNQYHFLAHLTSVSLETTPNGTSIPVSQIEKALYTCQPGTSALIIRTLPNDRTKLQKVYSGQEPPYLQSDAAKALFNAGIQHLLVDLPSLDHENEPNLPAHKAFFGYPEATSSERTVTELIYVPDEVKDGTYLLNLHVLAIESDASPSHPILFELKG